MPPGSDLPAENESGGRICELGMPCVPCECDDGWDLRRYGPNPMFTNCGRTRRSIENSRTRCVVSLIQKMTNNIITYSIANIVGQKNSITSQYVMTSV